MEAKLLESKRKEINPSQVAVYTISKFIDKERPFFISTLEREREREEYLMEPDEENSTELGEIPHEEKKGTLVPGWIRGPYGMTSFYRY